MKKWFIALAALALLLIPSVAMADADGPQYCSACGECMEKVSVTPYERYHVILWECKSCDITQKTYPNHTLGAATCVGCICTVCDYRSDVDMNEFNHVNPTIIGYTRVDSNEHSKVIYCDACDGREWIYEKHTFGKWTSTEDGKKHTGSCLCGEETTADHTGGNPTCQTSATCSVCKLSYYGSHNWGEWQPGTINTRLHYRICQNAGCSASESESHDGNSNCVTPATCSKCHASYTDTTKHAGPFTYLYNKYDESFHKRIETCTACGNETGNKVTTKHEESTPAECTHAAWCNVCNQAYGDPNPDNHRWGNWTYENENLHYRICSHNESHIQHADHRGYATCIDSMPCLDCGLTYKDPDKHQGGTDFDYTNVSDTEHKVTVICGGCHGEIKTYQEGHSEHTPATCSSRAICAKCSTPFGDLASNNHIGEATTTYVKTSETQHTPTTTYSDCPHSVEGTPEAHTAATPATCQTAAYCAVCESYYGEVDPDAHALESHGAQAPTCTEVGWEAYQTCTREGCAYTTYVEKKPLKHKLAYHSGRTPTCTIIGWDPYYACLRCDYSTYAVKRALGHDIVNHAAQAPTCTEVGWNAYDTCSRCDYTTYVEKKVLGHNLVNHAAKAPTCTEVGWNAYDTCFRCDYTTYVEKKALGHDIVNHAAQAPTCTEIGWNAYQTCKRCDYTTYVEKKALGHDIVNHAAKAPTCTEIGWNAYQTCKRCDYITYVEKKALGHDIVNHAAKAPTCTEPGWSTYITCKRCDYTTYAELAALGHQYGEWIPNADGTHTSACLRSCGAERTADCAPFVYVLPAEGVRAEFILCPVCGEIREIRLLDAEGELVETLEGTVLLPVEDATAEALTETLPEGALVVRMDALENGALLMSVAFEEDGKLTQPSGQIRITRPAEALEGYTLALLDADGTETPIDLEIEEETASFALDFTESQTPVALLRLVPLA